MSLQRTWGGSGGPQGGSGAPPGCFRGAVLTVPVPAGDDSLRLSHLKVGASADIPLDIGETDLSQLTATVTAPSGRKEPCQLKRLRNGHIGEGGTLLGTLLGTRGHRPRRLAVGVRGAQPAPTPLQCLLMSPYPPVSPLCPHVPTLPCLCPLCPHTPVMMSLSLCPFVLTPPSPCPDLCLLRVPLPCPFSIPIL